MYVCTYLTPSKKYKNYMFYMYVIIYYTMYVYDWIHERIFSQFSRDHSRCSKNSNKRDVIILPSFTFLFQLFFAERVLVLNSQILKLCFNG